MKTLVIVSTTPDERAEMTLKTAKALGYYTVFCGDRPDDIIAELADECHEIDWEDPSSLLKITADAKADGIVGLCDKAMIPVARVSTELGLIGNSPESIEILLSKNKFRKLQKKAQVFCPGHVVVHNKEELDQAALPLRFPLIVKPELCSSSFGQTVVNDMEELKAAFSEASANSRNSSVCVEEFVEHKSLRARELDVFLLGDEIVWDGLRDSYRVERAPLRPIYDVYPAELTEEEAGRIKETVEVVLKESGVRIGHYNIEGYFTEDGDFFVIEINPRPSGYYNPQHIHYFCGVDLTKLLVTTAVGDNSYFESQKTLPKTRRNMITYSVFSDREGILDHVHIDPSLSDKLVEQRYPLGCKDGKPVPDILTATRPLSIPVFEFESKEETEKIRREIDSLVYAVLKEEAESESDEPGEFGTEGESDEFGTEGESGEFGTEDESGEFGTEGESGEPGESQAQVEPGEP